MYNRTIHNRWRLYRRWRVQQSTTLCTLVTMEYLKYIRGCVHYSILYYLPADMYKLYNGRMHVRWRVHRRWRVQQSTTLCILVTMEYLKYIRGCVYYSIFYYLPADMYKLYNSRRIHVRWRVHRRWRVQQSTTLYTLVTTEYLSTYEVACTTVYYIIFQPTCTGCTTEEYILGREYIGGGEYSSRQRCVHW